MSRPLVGVGAVIWNDQQQVLLVRRSKPPRKGEWSLPGGHVEFGETLKDAILREVREETSLSAEVVGLIDVVESITVDAEGTPALHYVLVDFTLRAVSETAIAGSDASDAAWFDTESLAVLPLWDETRRIVGLSASRHLGLKLP